MAAAPLATVAENQFPIGKNEWMAAPPCPINTPNYPAPQHAHHTFCLSKRLPFPRHHHHLVARAFAVCRAFRYFALDAYLASTWSFGAQHCAAQCGKCCFCCCHGLCQDPVTESAAIAATQNLLFIARRSTWGLPAPYLSTGPNSQSASSLPCLPRLSGFAAAVQDLGAAACTRPRQRTLVHHSHAPPSALFCLRILP
ncbi:hypothetical protein COCC4DRAFT_80896 [Bipolaris maydis ATCC 48331]|uniref:Uncharacterized protein n=1 Tax=Cochliobolus heterostrophus (strain C4 / ATCC 48331 / race T) TaxID=665024 RepID=N4XLF9_COCH4|nr:uncharacterized protein COCC4DRAFT_80896 [Bipolaris maydis ATCC 48331]ENI05977.1 hypothetical protein COCC4DRAFT_80896 [Bipolaris maydis ATCC 48331]KAJ5022679.1 hypothetical protein J3E73DRAFT_341445 [Bipolaris maydis]KAJ6267926.1 hypothetical protein PSV08DRAFT_323154 [Bipolaris maydis]KAJ6277171.1 hypothetical protein J3E71DRAFT_329376 [Bipolaris maydis]